MHLVCVLLALWAAPFWESKTPHEWTEQEIRLLMHDSPWAQMAEPAPAVQVYLASADPLREAEEEISRRREKPLNEEYLDYVREQRGRKIIIAIVFKDLDALADAKEARHMEEESIMKVGRQKYKMEGHFPPTPDDPVLRLVFPQVVTERDKTIQFDLYVPGSGPFHDAEFRIRDMLYKGKLTM